MKNKIMNRFPIICTFFCLVVSGSISANPEVEIEDGLLKGLFLKTRSGRQFIGFKGIPYAKPPIGELRFKAPIPNERWEGVLDATKSRDVCIQIDDFTHVQKGVFGSENCLHLNVYTPEIPTQGGKLLPVMVFIHGGAYITGSGNAEYYGPEILLDKDIVLVSINYRLGPFGFLSTEDELCPGNYGLKDQSLALKWVKKNIKSFGGDPNSITIFGESAGGASTHYQMLSPLSKGLFHRVISQSGSSLCRWAYANQGENLKNTKILSESMGCSTSSNEKIIECLRNMDAAAILKKQNIFIESPLDFPIPFKPAIEKQSPEAFLTDTPQNLIKSNRNPQIPYLLGLNSDEGLLTVAGLMTNPKYLDLLNDDFSKQIGILLNIKNEKILETIAKKIRKFYFGDSKKIRMKNEFRGMIDFFSDVEFTSCLEETIRLHLTTRESSIFTYLFSHYGSISFTKVLGVDEYYGVCHADELLYLFGTMYGEEPFKNMTNDDNQVSDMLTNYWINFAETGSPTSDKTSKNEWKPTATDELEYYNINLNEPEMQSPLFGERIKFWRELKTQLKKHKINSKEDL